MDRWIVFKIMHCLYAFHISPHFWTPSLDGIKSWQIYCWVTFLSNYNIKYICTIYTRIDTCLMSISRFSLRDKITLRLLKLYLYIADVAEWSRVLDIRLSDWCCSVSMVWVQIPSREELASSQCQPRLSSISNVAPGGSDCSIHIKFNYCIIRSEWFE
jgi:hypothetical protein